jgi:NDP-sugar pyrophosphorylase family protein
MLQAVIMVGGRGERLRAASEGNPKPLVSVAGRPLLSWTLEGLRNRGFKRVTLCVGPRAEPFMKFLDSPHGRAATEGLHIAIVEESQPLGTIGAWLRCELEPGPCLVQNGDVLTTLDQAALVQRHMDSGAAWTVATHQAVLRTRFGAIEATPDGRLLSYHEKPEATWEFSSGINVLQDRLQTTILASEEVAALPLPKMLEALVAMGVEVHVARHHALWVDINDPDDLRIAERELDPGLQRAILGHGPGPDPQRRTRFGERGWSF